MTLRMGEHDLKWDEHVVELRESDPDEDPATLRDRLADDGYLLLRGFHDPERVRAARREVAATLDDEGLLADGEPVEDAIIGESGEGYFLDGAAWEAYPHLHDLVAGGATMDFFAEFVGARPLTYDYKWGRAKGRGDFTGFHYDRVFMGRGTEDLYTLWTPLGDVPPEMGPLLVHAGAHEHDRLRETYGAMDVDRDVFEATFSSDPHDVLDTLGGKFATAEFEAGDALLFGQYNLHGSLSNRTGRYRISVDTRYQSIEDPVDGRWVGRDPVGHYNWPSEDETPMAELRERWGL